MRWHTTPSGKGSTSDSSCLNDAIDSKKGPTKPFILHWDQIPEAKMAISKKKVTEMRCLFRIKCKKQLFPAILDQTWHRPPMDSVVRKPNNLDFVTMPITHRFRASILDINHRNKATHRIYLSVIARPMIEKCVPSAISSDSHEGFGTERFPERYRLQQQVNLGIGHRAICQSR